MHCDCMRVSDLPSVKNCISLVSDKTSNVVTPTFKARAKLKDLILFRLTLVLLSCKCYDHSDSFRSIQEPVYKKKSDFEINL